jgi:hypothetical protein
MKLNVNAEGYELHAIMCSVNLIIYIYIYIYIYSYMPIDVYFIELYTIEKKMNLKRKKNFERQEVLKVKYINFMK